MPSGASGGSPSLHQCKTLPDPSLACPCLCTLPRKPARWAGLNTNPRGATRQGKPLQPLPPRVSFLGIAPASVPAAGKAKYEGAAGLGFVEAIGEKLGFKPWRQHRGPDLQKGRGAAATAGLRTLSSSANHNWKKPKIVPLLVVCEDPQYSACPPLTYERSWTKRVR